MTREEAIKIVRTATVWTDEEREALGVLIPEFKESEDERIRKAIWLILIATEDEQKDFYSTHGLTRKDCTDWLEKQKLVECIDFNNEFENQISHLLASVLNGEYEYNKAFINYAAQSLLGYAKNEMKPNEWSEEDEVYLQDALWCVKQAAKVAKDENDMGTCWSAERFLKSLSLKLKKEKRNEDI